MQKTPASIGESQSGTEASTSDAERSVPTPTTDIDDRKPVTREVPADEFGGRPGPDPTRYGDWEKNGRCIDF